MILLHSTRRICILFLLVFLAPAIAACFIRPSEEAKLAQWKWGSNLAIRVVEMDQQDQISYLSGEQHFIIKPSSSEAVLRALKVEIYQNYSAVLSLTPNSPKVSLSYSTDKRSLPIPLNKGNPASQEAASPYLRSPFFSDRVTLPKGNIVSGWLVFEVPKGSQPFQLVWDDVDHVSVPLPIR